ncbi:hypothetical protein PENTCL1PPCAC_3291, partial [Pristionchus entomophagus]
RSCIPPAGASGPSIPSDIYPPYTCKCSPRTWRLHKSYPNVSWLSMSVETRHCIERAATITVAHSTTRTCGVIGWETAERTA